MSEGPSIGMANDINIVKDPFNSRFKTKFKGTWIANFGYTFDTANDHIKKGWADLVSFGWLYVANPDLVEKFQSNAELNSVKYIPDMS